MADNSAIKWTCAAIVSAAIGLAWAVEPPRIVISGDDIVPLRIERPQRHRGTPPGAASATWTTIVASSPTTNCVSTPTSTNATAYATSVGTR